MIKVKICGITRLEDAICAQNANAWAIGYIFTKKSPRYIEPAKAGEISSQIAGNLEKTGVFVNSPAEEIVNISQTAGLTKIQLHGEETSEFCSKIRNLTGKEVVKALRVRDESSLKLIDAYQSSVSYILLDSYSKEHHGGTGETFNWKIAQKAVKYDVPIILAGGITPDNILGAYKQVCPYAIDISSGVELSKGIKDEAKISKLKKLIVNI